MENKLEIVKKENFGDLECDFYKNEKGEIFVTRTQIGQALEYSNPNDAIRMIHNRNKERMDKFSVPFKMNGVKTYLYNARGIYEICRYSNQPKANDFYDWIYDALEKIRTTGGYIYGEEIMNEDQLIMATMNVLNKKVQNLQLENMQQKQIIGELKSKADYTDIILQNKSLIKVKAIAKDYGMSATEMNKLLHELGVQYKEGNQWFLYSKYQDHGYTSSETISLKHKDGTGFTKLNTKWTQKGRLFLYELLKKNGLLPMIEREV